MNYQTRHGEYNVVQIQHAQSYGSVLILHHQIGVRGVLMQGRRQRGGSGARSPHLKSVPPISRLAPCLLHTSNTVFWKCGPSSGFWPLLLVIAPPLLRNPGDDPGLLPASPSAPTPHESQNYTISDKITPLWKRICELPEIQIGCYWGDSRSTASLGLITRFILIDCNRSSFVSPIFPFTFILAGTIVAL